MCIKKAAVVGRYGVTFLIKLYKGYGQTKVVATQNHVNWNWIHVHVIGLIVDFFSNSKSHVGYPLTFVFPYGLPG